MVENAYLIPLLPLVSALVIFFFGRWLPRRGALLGILTMGVCLGMSFDLLMRLLDHSFRAPMERAWPWFSVGIFPFEWGILLDGPAIVMCLVVSTVSLVVQIYSLGYMRRVLRFKRFYAYLSLFSASMLGLVLANNFLQFFVGWELMGACSYFLIGFEFEREPAAAAGNKAFLTTRVGDLGFYLGLLAIFYTTGTFNFIQIQSHISDGAVSPNMALLIALVLFWGAVGKSAQLPLHVWLPDAMEGPTPVSALIHAATMVAAGIYLTARSYAFFLRAPGALDVVAWTGGTTALFAATIALTSNDIKKVLAYSTISQLGYMMLGLGVMGYGAGLFHLTTHAAFKALLFLGAGSVIHAVHTQDLWKMGSLSKQMATTFSTFLIGSAALAGVPPLAGFYSKDMILGVLFASGHRVLFAMALTAVFLTALYMTRTCQLAFLGEPHDRERFTGAHESGWAMTIPLMILAILAVGLGWVMHRGTLLAELFPWPAILEKEGSFLVTVLALGASGAGILVGVVVYGSGSERAAALAKFFWPLHGLFRNKWFVDEIYQAALIRPVLVFAGITAKFDDECLDRWVIDGAGRAVRGVARAKAWVDDHVVDRIVDGVGQWVTAGGGWLRRFQTGWVQNYLLVVTAGFLVLAFWAIWFRP